MPTVRKTQSRLGIAAGLIYGAHGLGLAYAMRGLRFDDPFITYRYAENLASGNGFVFNPGDTNPTLLTTTPLYALLLSVPRWLGADLPSVSYWLSVAALLAAAFGLYALGQQQKRPFVGFSSGLALLLFPLLWLTMGFETPLFIAVAIWAAWALGLRWQRGGVVLAGGLCGVAMGLRGDGVLLLLVIGFTLLMRCLPAPSPVADPNPIPQPTPSQRRQRGLLPWLRKNLVVERPPRLTGNLRDLRLRDLAPLLWLAVAAFSIYMPLAAWLTAQFGSPIPTTLATKTAQAAAGLTGFYPFTHYPEGALMLVRAYREQSRFFFSVLIGLALALALQTLIRGLVLLFRRNKRDWAAQLGWSLVQFWQTQGGLAAVVLWAVAHFVGYTALGVAPYVWYYAPIVPGLTVLVGMLATRQRPQPRFAQVLAAPGQWLRRAVFLLNCILLLVVDLAIIGVLRGGTPPPPSQDGQAQLAAKVLPETKVDIYRQVGEWLHANTPTTATLGVTELGVMSYYAQRHAVDFLGLTHPQYRDSIRHGDFLRGLLSEQPDYVALTNINSIYTHNPQQEAWFQRLYRPIATFEDARFWGSPMTVWQRHAAPLLATHLADNVPHDLGGGWQVTAVRSSSQSIAAGQPLRLSVRLRYQGPIMPPATRDSTGGRELRAQAVFIQGGDGLPVVSRVIHTRQWRPADEDWVDFVFVAPDSLKSGAYRINLRWVDGGPEVNAGLLKVPFGDKPAASALLELSAGVRAAQLPAPIKACIGKPVEIPLQWLGGAALGGDYTAFVHVRNAQGTTVTQADGPPRNGLYPTSVWGRDEWVSDPRIVSIPADLVAGDYALVVGLYLPQTLARLPVLASPARTADGGLVIGHLRVERCG